MKMGEDGVIIEIQIYGNMFQFRGLGFFPSVVVAGHKYLMALVFQLK